MEVLRNLFEGYPNLWGGGVAHSVLILSLTIAFGIILAKIKVRGVSLGVTWILFVGLVFGPFNMNLDEHLSLIHISPRNPSSGYSRILPLHLSARFYSIHP